MQVHRYFPFWWFVSAVGPSDAIRAQRIHKRTLCSGECERVTATEFSSPWWRLTARHRCGKRPRVQRFGHVALDSATGKEFLTLPKIYDILDMQRHMLAH